MYTTTTTTPDHRLPPSSRWWWWCASCSQETARGRLRVVRQAAPRSAPGARRDPAAGRRAAGEEESDGVEGWPPPRHPRGRAGGRRAPGGEGRRGPWPSLTAGTSVSIRVTVKRSQDEPECVDNPGGSATAGMDDDQSWRHGQRASSLEGGVFRPPPIWRRARSCGQRRGCSL
ncbi:unnamed protein product [Prorocentrum cordatum]|uniref:Peptidylprolyl isomerase n=1 Tax=Prorocentrum cordatum TaxID=2364126 RepID=A0ABN9VM47_9DINO|nr:unnamed protein product [Polarella glacialis]